MEPGTQPRPGRARWVCAVEYGDPGPWNMTWDGNTATGLFDWDCAHAAPAMDDVAYALEYFAPFRSDTEAIRWLGFRTPPDRRRRIASSSTPTAWTASPAWSTP
jgi:hypothetical protein